jgi:hypothetical protein
MEELEKQIRDSFELAEFYKTEAKTASDQTLKISES